MNSDHNLPPTTVDWKPGDVIAARYSNFIPLLPSALSVAEMYHLMTGVIVPRPIALVSTISQDGHTNLAPFSFFNGVSSSPPCLAISIAALPDGGVKDTLSNIEQTGEFVVNTVPHWLAGPVTYASERFPYGTSEIDKTRLTPLPSSKVRPVRIQECPVHLECTVYAKQQVGSGGVGSATLIIGEIHAVHIASEAWRDGRVVYEALAPLSRHGGSFYGYGEQRMRCKV
jgi:flavin reductase (DIM6/NTAB) family NADH-FMN oxidoreductase RutF